MVDRKDPNGISSAGIITSLKHYIMASVSIYLNFNGNAEEAFNHYNSVPNTFL